MLQEIHGGLVPRRGEPEHLDRFTESVDLFVLFPLEFETVLEVPIRRAKGILAGLGQFFLRVNYINGPLLELNGVAAGSQGYTDQSLGKINITIVVNSDFRNDEARLIVSDQPVANPDCTHRQTPFWIMRTTGMRIESRPPSQTNIISVAVSIAETVQTLKYGHSR